MPARRVYVVPALPGCGLFETSSPPRFTCTAKALGPAVPPLSLTTWLTTVSFGAMSFAVIVQARGCPSGSVIEPSAPHWPVTAKV